MDPGQIDPRQPVNTDLPPFAVTGTEEVRGEWLHAKNRTFRRLFLSQVLGHWQDIEGARTKTGESVVPPSLKQSFGVDGLATAVTDLWAAERHLQPDFDVAVLHSDHVDRDTSIAPQKVWGVITASERPSMNGFYIHTLAVHPVLFEKTETYLGAADLLVETVIDASLVAGLRGWVVCSSSDSTAALWRDLGFSRQAGPFFFRMGYFDKAPVRKPV